MVFPCATFLMQDETQSPNKEDTLKTTDNMLGIRALSLDNNDELEMCVCGSTNIDKDTHRCIACQTRHLATWPDAHVYYSIMDVLNMRDVDKARVAVLESQLDAFERRPGW